MAATGPTLASFDAQPWWLIVLKAAAILLFLLLGTVIAIWAERRLIGRMQNRPGPNRAGPFGLLQPIADALKLTFKEDIVPRRADKVLFWAAPVVSATPALVSFAVIPFGPVVSIAGVRTPLQLADLPVAVLLVLAMSSLGVYGIVLSGWSANSAYALLGALRSCAQVISYEIAMGLSMVPVFLSSGSLSTTAIVAAQSHGGEFHCFGAGLYYPSWVLRAPAAVLRGLPGHHGRRDQPAAVRPARRRGRARGRVPHRVLLHEVPGTPAGRVLQRDHRVGAGHHLVPRRLGGALADLRMARRKRGLVATTVVPRQGLSLHVRVLLAPRHPAPAPLRPADEAGLESPHPGIAGLDPGHRHDQGMAQHRRQQPGLHRRRADHHRASHRGLGSEQRQRAPGKPASASRGQPGQKK